LLKGHLETEKQNLGIRLLLNLPRPPSRIHAISNLIRSAKALCGHTRSWRTLIKGGRIITELGFPIQYSRFPWGYRYRFRPGQQAILVSLVAQSYPAIKLWRKKSCWYRRHGKPGTSRCAHSHDERCR